VSIEIANECSGIRSSIGLFISLLIASHMFLKRWWSKTALMVMVIPMVLVKNAIRITTLTLLAVHVDKAFLISSPLHQSGGIVFFALALLLVLPVLVLLRRCEGRFQEERNFH
jgi:exosortase/archaeosortase family protein